jgi:hypothetical protein
LTSKIHTFIGRVVIIAALMAGPGVALARDADPLEVPLKHYVFFLGIAMAGGLVSWFAKVKAGTAQIYNLSGMVGELATSAFAGLLVFWLCAYSDVPQTLTAALVAMAGHMGTKAISQLEQWAQNRFAAQAPKT